MTTSTALFRNLPKRAPHGILFRDGQIDGDIRFTAMSYIWTKCKFLTHISTIFDTEALLGYDLISNLPFYS